jgi:hypothetical protein
VTTDNKADQLSARTGKLTSELRTLDLELKAGQTPEGPVLREFRQALDNVRMTAWTVNELMDARDLKKDPHTVLSFLTAERLRRFGQLVEDLCTDIEQDEVTAQTRGIQSLSNSVRQLQERLSSLVNRRTARSKASNT